MASQKYVRARVSLRPSLVFLFFYTRCKCFIPFREPCTPVSCSKGFICDHWIYFYLHSVSGKYVVFLVSPLKMKPCNIKAEHLHIIYIVTYCFTWYIHFERYVFRFNTYLNIESLMIVIIVKNHDRSYIIHHLWTQTVIGHFIFKFLQKVHYLFWWFSKCISKLLALYLHLQGSMNQQWVLCSRQNACRNLWLYKITIKKTFVFT